MIPLIMASSGDSVTITSIKGSEETRRHIANLGFVPGAEVKIISKDKGNLIVNIKEARFAITEEMARHICF